jgi:hypothetical protein
MVEALQDYAIGLQPLNQASAAAYGGYQHLCFLQVS